MPRRSHLLLTVLCAVSILGLSACGSSPAARFYTLTSLHGEPASSMVEVPDRRGILAVGPVEIADYLDRPQIVRRSGPTVLSPMEFDRWAGSLRDDVVRVLVDNLALFLVPDGMVVVPWEETARHDRRLGISVNRFELMENGSVLLRAHWMLYGREKGELLGSGTMVLVEPVSGRGVEAQVEAMSRALGELSRRIAVKVKAQQPLRSAVRRQVHQKTPGGHYSDFPGFNLDLLFLAPGHDGAFRQFQFSHGFSERDYFPLAGLRIGH